jgi:uncharacterized membrane protein
MSKLPPPPASVWIILGPALLVAALLVLLSIFAQTEKRPSDRGWKGIFYSNPEDPALLVPKRFGIGWTLNFGNPWSWVVLALILLMVALPFILSTPTMHQPR